MLREKASYSWYRAIVLSISLLMIPHCGLAMHDNVLAMGISFGSQLVSGTARVVTALSQLDKVEEGDIIVACSTDRSWESGMRLAAGIITDHGGGSCHAVLFGKKMGIPVLVGACNATKKIIDGQYITIDCAKNSAYKSCGKEDKGFVSHHIVANKPSGSVYVDTPSSVSYSSASPARSIVQEEHAVGHKRQKNGYDAKSLYAKHYFHFEKYVLGMRNEVWWGRKTGTIMAGAKIFGCDDFAMKCVDFVYPFFDRTEKYIIDTLKTICSKKYIEAMEKMIVRCSEKPHDLNWVAFVTHQEHVENVTLPGDVDRDVLKKDPRAYKEIIDQNRVSAAERDSFIAAGLFARYLVEKKLL